MMWLCRIQQHQTAISNTTVRAAFFSTSTWRCGGQKAKRRRHEARVDRPHLPTQAKTATPTGLALAHFDDFYSSCNKARWPSIRLGLLSRPKHCALVNNFGDSEATVEELLSLGCVDVGAAFMEARAKQAPFLPEERLIAEGPQEDEVIKKQEEEEEEEEAMLSSSLLTPEQAQSRLIEPEERALGGSSALYDFVPTKELKGMEEFVEEAEYYDYYRHIGRQDVRVTAEPQLTWPPALRVFTHARGVVDSLPPARPGLLGTLNYYCMDVASLLPVLALDLRPGAAVLDMCAGPGGKSLAMLQTLCPSTLVCNDIDSLRVRRVINVLDQFLGKDRGVGNVRDTVSLSKRDGALLTEYESFDRVLVDAPCYSDRHAVSSSEANLFVKEQIKNRLKMPERQTKLLRTGLMMLKPGGCLVYSTCTLSPIQNDGVVHRALRSMWEDTNLNFEVCDLSEAVKPMRSICKLHSRKEGLKYGQLFQTLIVPFCMVMSQESDEGALLSGGGGGKASPAAAIVGKEPKTDKEKEPKADKEEAKERVSDKEKELASEASSAFTRGDYSGCLAALERLEILRPTDCVLAHNKVVAQCRAANGGQQVALSEVVQHLEGLAKTLGLNLSGPKCEDEVDGSVLVYNLAVAKFQQRHMLQAFQLASRLLPLSSSLSPVFSRHILFLHCELCLALHQPELALSQATKLEALLSPPPSSTSLGGSSEAAEAEAEAGRVLVLKARCQVMARQTRSLKKELKSVSLPGAQGQTCEFVRAHIEALHNNHRKSIKMLNSCVQAAGNRVFPHYYNNLGCLHQVMHKPNLAIYYFKNALDRLDSSSQGGGGEGGGGGGGGKATAGVGVGGQAQDSCSWLTQSQVLYNIGVSLLHAKRAAVAFDILVEVVAAHYLDPHVWFHLAECCLMAVQSDNNPHLTRGGGEGVAGGEAASHHKLVVASEPGKGGAGVATTPSLSYEFAYVCLKNAESLLPSFEQAETSGVFCEGVGYIGNPVTWAEVENLRVAVLTAKAYTALALGDYIPAGTFAEELLASNDDLPGGYRMLAHLYAAESLILQDKLTEALPHLDPDNVTSVEVTFPNSEGAPSARQGPLWYPDSLESGKMAVQFNLAVGFALREEWEKSGSIMALLYRDGGNVPVQVLLLVLYLSLRTGQVERARRIVRERCHRAPGQLLDSGQ